jgi:ketosteroid isomerase-like protein
MSAKLVDDFFTAMVSGDLDSIESMFHDDVSMTDHGNGMTSDGVEANMNDVRNWKNTFSDMNISAVRHSSHRNAYAGNQYW